MDELILIIKTELNNIQANNIELFKQIQAELLKEYHTTCAILWSSTIILALSAIFLGVIHAKLKAKIHEGVFITVILCLVLLFALSGAYSANNYPSFGHILKVCINSR